MACKRWNMSDVKIVSKILTLVPNASFKLEKDKCVYASFIDKDSTFQGCLRSKTQKEKNAILKLLANLNNLQVLDLRKNRLEKIPEFNMPHLKHLDLASNYLGYVPNFANKLHMNFLNLGVNNLENIPDWIFSLEKLKVLKLHKNKIRSIGSLETLKDLEFLNLYLNKIKNIPDQICKLTNLKFFSWGMSGITSLPKDIGNLHKLEWLSLVANKIKSLPDSVCNLKNMVGLRLNKNHLEYLPNDIGNLENLRELSLYNNKIKKVPRSFYNLKLEKLNICGNLFSLSQHMNCKWVCQQESDCIWQDEK